MSELIDVGELDRSTYLGGADVAAVMGVGATYEGIQQTPVTVYLKKTGQAPDLDERQQLFLKRRKRFEGPIVEMLREEFQGNIVGMNRRYRDPEYPFLAAEIDWEWQDHDGSIQNGETKTVFILSYNETKGWGEPGTSDYPVEYVTQNMYGLGITGRRTCILAAMIGIDQMFFYRLERDDGLIATIRERCNDFWFNHVLPRIPPEPLNLTDATLLTMRVRGRPVELDDETLHQLERLRGLRQEATAIEDEESDIKFHILDYVRKKWAVMGDAELKEDAALMHHGIKVASFNGQVTRRIDADRLRKEYPDIASECTKESKSRVLRIAKL